MELLSRKQAAQYLGLKPQTLALWACKHTHNLPYVKIGSSVKYKLDDLNKFIEDNTQ